MPKVSIFIKIKRLRNIKRHLTFWVPKSRACQRDPPPFFFSLKEGGRGGFSPASVSFALCRPGFARAIEGRHPGGTVSPVVMAER